MEPSPAAGELGAMLRAAADFASYPGLHSDDTVRQFLERCPLPKLLGALQSEADVPGMVETVTECLDKIFSSRYGASLLPSYGAFIQAGLLTDSKQIRKLACKAVLHLLDKAEDGAAVETVVQHNLFPLMINCLIEGDEEISAIILDTVKRLAQIPKGAEVIFPPDGQGSVQLGKVAAQSSSLPRIRILSLIAKLFTVSSYTASAIRDTNLLSIFEEEIKDTRDMLKTLSALEVLYELVEHPHSNIFLLKTNLLQLIVDIINDSSADSVIRSRAALISGRLLSSADAFTAIDKSCVTNLLVAIDKILKMEESQNTDEIESALETLGLIGTTSQGAHFLLTSSNVARHVVKSSFDRQGRGRQLAALHAFGSICGMDRQEDQMKLDDEAEGNLKRLVYTTAANSPKLTPSAALLSILQQDPDIRIAGYRVISGLVIREWCLREVCLNSEIIRFVTDPTMETTKLGMEARYNCCVAINKALSSSHLLHEASLSGLIGKLNDAVKRGPYLSERKRVEARPVVDTAERF
ncbi:uncharacterized protein LOC8074574 isoform X2 [Sorghum bicolor]|uniref:ARM repeat superfamily protein n=1 Tax=Sorghum bicolor TaxID=4558 RepID=C5YVF7_SORBI|nr:uncharacterized protein LOC8074574 isoform X2 [Sorghum bicolor]EES18659.1 hypothetical protein SORBI_3009G227700 [Sorghum bicolor]|eukprot:XP_002440229.1 uncharacterized protein LOC8074574 isoform X2 [Sorghum bicolor]